ncbi:MAG: hypothetical protein ACMG6S_07365 [Byssovorax sp.]
MRSTASAPLISVPRMSTMTRRGALAACAALTLPVPSEVDVVDEDPRPVFVTLTRNPFPGTDLDALNANLLESHEGLLWVHDHRDNLPTEYEEIDRLPANYREALLAALPVATVIDLVLERIQRCTDAYPGLTNEQRAVLASAPLSLTPEWCEASGEVREAKWPDGGFWQHTREVFTLEEWSRIFGSDEIGDWWAFARFGGLNVSVQAVGW